MGFFFDFDEVGFFLFDGGKNNEREEKFLSIMMRKYIERYKKQFVAYKDKAFLFWGERENLELTLNHAQKVIKIKKIKELITRTQFDFGEEKKMDIYVFGIIF